MPVLSRRKLEMPAAKQFLLAFCGYALSLVGIEVDLPVVADVREVRSDGADPPGRRR